MQSLVRDLDSPGPFQLDRRLRRAVRLEQRLDAGIGARLTLVAHEPARGTAGALAFSMLPVVILDVDATEREFLEDRAPLQLCRRVLESETSWAPDLFSHRR
jgi:hypothetical protein